MDHFVEARLRKLYWSHGALRRIINEDRNMFTARERKVHHRHPTFSAHILPAMDRKRPDAFYSVQGIVIPRQFSPIALEESSESVDS